WLDRLPEMVHEQERRWNLTPDVPLQRKVPSGSYVTAVLCAEKKPAGLKIAMPHLEEERENHGLGFWGGGPTVGLLASDDELGACFWSVVSQARRSAFSRSANRTW